jgi:hypothetical protein
MRENNEKKCQKVRCPKNGSRLHIILYYILLTETVMIHSFDMVVTKSESDRLCLSACRCLVSSAHSQSCLSFIVNSLYSNRNRHTQYNKERKGHCSVKRLQMVNHINIFFYIGQDDISKNVLILLNIHMKEFDDVQHRVYIEYIKCTVRYDECCSFFFY